MRHGRLTILLSVALLAAVPAGASGHGGTDHGERLVDGRLVAVEAAAPPGSSTRSRAVERWRATGPRPIAIVQVLMPGRDTSRYPEYSEDTLRGAFVTDTGSASRALNEMTDGIVSLTGRVRTDGDVLPSVTASSSGDCRWQTWARDARTQLTALGHDLEPYLQDGNVAYVLRGPTGCSWGGLAWMPGTEIWLSNSLRRSLIVHELGHNFDLDHASSARCHDASGARVFLAGESGCTLSEYGDPFDPMGNGDRHYSAAHRLAGGWVGEGRVRTVTASGRYALDPAAVALSATRMLRVPRPGGRDLLIELRRPYGQFDAFSSSDPAVNGVLLRLHDPASSDGRTRLLDAETSTTTFSDAALAVGRKVTDAETGIAVRLASLDEDGARVDVTVPGTADVLAPSAPEPAATLDGERVVLSWTASTDDAGVDRYRVSRDGQVLGETTALTWTDDPAAGATSHEYVVTALDAAGNSSSSPSLVVSLVRPVLEVLAPLSATTPPPATTTPPSGSEPPVSTPDAPTVIRPWRTPYRVVVDGRRRSARALASRGGGTVRGRSVRVRFPRSVRQLRVATKGCRARITVRTGRSWRTLARMRTARASLRSGSAVREVQVRCATSRRARVTVDQLSGR